MRWITYSILGAGTVFSIGSLISDARWNTEVWAILASVLFGLWVASPYVALGFLCATPRRYAAPCWVALVGAIPPVIYGGWAYVHILYLHLDAQSALAYIFVPLYQWGWTAVVLIVWFILIKTARHDGSGSNPAEWR